MARRLLYTHDVIRRRLSLQLTLVMLLVALVPLAGAGYLTLGLIERSIREQVRSNHEQLARASGMLVSNYLREALTKLKTIAARVPLSNKQVEQALQLDRQTEPPGMFLEIGFVDNAQQVPEVLAQSQQQEYNDVQRMNSAGNRAYNPRLKQSVVQWSNDMPNIALPAKGQDFVATQLEVAKEFPSLAMSIPARNGILTANLDFRPVTQLLAGVAASDRYLVVLEDSSGKRLTASRENASPGPDDVVFRRPVGHGDWRIAIHQPGEFALAPLRAARQQALIWFGLGGTMAIGLAFLFAGRVVRPVRSLAATADALGRGEFAARTGIAREDEIGQLAQAFDRMAAAVQQLDLMKGEFVAHVSHELRTPLTSAKVTLANVQEGIGGTESLGRVQEDLDRLIRMVNELLDVARIDAGLTLAKQRTDLGALVRSTVETIRPLAKVALSVDGAGETLDLDAARVQQIVLNLVDNALKYAKTKVTVDVRGREVRVTDDGPGVPPEHRERIFEKFTKVETGPKPPGAGLGLSIARKLAQLHGGTLVCEGNTFVLRF
jgi:signal transduction histidine kinase